MSKYKQKKEQKVQSSYETDVRFERSIEISGWFFLIAIIGFLGLWIIFDFLLDVSMIDFEANVYSFTYIVFTGTSSAFAFSVSWNIKSNREKKKQIFFDWLLGEFLLCLFAIFALAIYQW